MLLVSSILDVQLIVNMGAPAADLQADRFLLFLAQS